MRLFSNVFDVQERDGRSSRRRRDVGLCQGCPLYILFRFQLVIVMALLMHDVTQMVAIAGQETFRNDTPSELLYADGKVLVDPMHDAALL